MSLSVLRTELRRFAAERDWDQFHSPKNLAISLSIEAAELLEHFQWLSEEHSRRLAQTKIRKLSEEMADVFIYLLRLADKLNVDLVLAAQRKMRLNARRYPTAKSKGISKKYTEL